MSYGRKPYYIYPDVNGYVWFDGVKVPDRVVNAFLYKILMTQHRDDLKKRLIDGKEVWASVNKDDQDYLDWLDDTDNAILQELMGVE